MHLEVLLPLSLAVRGKIVPDDRAPGNGMTMLEEESDIFYLSPSPSGALAPLSDK